MLKSMLPEILSAVRDDCAQEQAFCRLLEKYVASEHVLCFLTLESLNKKKLHEHFQEGPGGGGRLIGPPPPSTFNTIDLIEMIFGTYNEFPLYFHF